MNNITRGRESGVTSLFIVLFATLLFTVITVGFLSLMINDQRRAVDSEWSDGAYDSALAGVEDGKRLLDLCRKSPGSEACKAIAQKKCNTVSAAGLVVEKNGEVLVRSQSGGGSLEGNSGNQAYTCVIINRDTPNYKGELKEDESVLIPLDSGGKEFNSVRLSWFMAKDSSTGKATFATSGVSLPKRALWSTTITRPPIMRMQFMQYNRDAIDLAKFNENEYAHTAFLYPSRVGISNVNLATDDPRALEDFSSPASSLEKTMPRAVTCVENIISYSCSTVIGLPNPGIAPSAREALLRVTAIYGATSYQLEMMKDNSIVNFVDVLPSIDSTGRAGDIFRRVEARIDMTGAASEPYPRATIDISGNLCKNFRITDAPKAWACDNR